MRDKIDFVITWVDGNDKEWQKEKSKYKPDSTNDNSDVRYRDFEYLKYWFRAIEKNANWVNKIFFVTYGHIPKWLNIDHPKLCIVKHSDFIPQKYLPTFSSTAIEMNLHRIENLSENFVYFNDDMFVLNKTKPTDFFKNGLPCDSAILSAIIPSGKDLFEHRLVNNINIINKYFKMKKVIFNNFFKWFNYKYGLEQIRTILLLPWNNFSSIKISHLPASLKKSNFIELWNLEPKVMEDTCIQKFRNITSVNPWLIQNWQMVKGQFYPRRTSFGKFFILNDNDKRLDHLILKSNYKMICINDDKNIRDFDKLKIHIHSLFEQKFPEKSSYEK